MIRFSIPAFIKFAVGIVLLQGATALLVCAAQAANLKETWLPMFGLALLIGLFVALWFSSIARHSNQHVLARASEKFNREREQIRRQSEKEKTKEVEGRLRQFVRDSRRVQRRSNVKRSTALAGLLSVGMVLFLAQFMTLGMLALFLSGGALFGYTLWARRHHLPSGLRLDWRDLRNVRTRPWRESTASRPIGVIEDRRGRTNLQGC